jgi:ankyrin repeat protein
MSHPNDINLNTLEKMTSMKNMFGNSIIEILKPNIKSHQNESVIKMLEIAKDKPYTYMELLSVAIFHRNFEIIKYMVEKFNITESDSPFMSALSFYNSILPDNSEFKLNDARENYNMIQCPFVIMSGIGGDVEIFKYLSKKNLISNKDETGIIGLSKKLKNSFYSNIIGACCYYGRIELLEYLLKNNKFDLNFVTSEKKSKAGRVGYSKEYLGLTPAMLAVVGNMSDENTVKILKILNNYNCKFTGFDHNKDNILHLATKNKKIETAKYLVDELNLKELMGNTNKDGNTPLSLAQKLNNEIFINYYSDKEKIDEKQIEENLKELINESNKIKDKYNKKKSKKNKNQDEPSLLNSTEYEETLKEIKPSKNKNKKKNYSTHNDV